MKEGVNILRGFQIFLFRRVFCDGYVMMANFSWRQRRHFLDVLL